MSTFGYKIKKLREGKGLSLRMLEDKIGITPGLISKYENDLVEPGITVLKKYKKYFGVSLDYLCNDEEE